MKVEKKKCLPFPFALVGCLTKLPYLLLGEVAFVAPTRVCSVVVDAPPVERPAQKGYILPGAIGPDLYEKSDYLSVWELSKWV